jgi:hypothetical protein
MGLVISASTETTDFLPGEENHPEGSARSQTDFFKQARGTQSDEATGSVIVGTGAHIPGVQMAPEQNNLLRIFAASDLPDYVGTFVVRMGL